jgi:hypothetical protein
LAVNSRQQFREFSPDHAPGRPRYAKPSQRRTLHLHAVIDDSVVGGVEEAIEVRVAGA